LQNPFTMCSTFFLAKYNFTFFCFIHLKSLHSLIKINKMTIKFGSIHASKFSFVSYR
jgi:hypothetical protein